MKSTLDVPCPKAPVVDVTENEVPSGKHTHKYGKSPCLMGKSTIAMLNYYVK